MSNVPSVAPYGTWKSPISTDMLSQKSLLLLETGLDGRDVYWTEAHLDDGGRAVLMHDTGDGAAKALTCPPFDVRTQVYGIRGGTFLVHQNTLYASHRDDGRIYRLEREAAPTAVTGPHPTWRFADAIMDPHRHRLIAVRQDLHEPRAVRHALVAIPLDQPNTPGVPLDSPSEFCMAPRLSPDGTQLAWVGWHAPHMPWDSTTLWIADIAEDGSLRNPRSIAGEANESIVQPSWSPDGRLFFVSDRSGWWNLYTWDSEQVRAITALHAEFGEAPTEFGLSTYGFLNECDILASYWQAGTARLVKIDRTTREMTHLPCPFSRISRLRVSGSRAIMIASSDRAATALVLFDADTRRFQTLRRQTGAPLEEDGLSVPETFQFPTADGRTADAFYYPPQNKDYIPPEGELPPLIVNLRSGAPSQAYACFDPAVQFWTSRGFAVVDVNGRGSTGYGRAHRMQLSGPLGPAGVQDAIDVTTFLTRHDRADGRRVVVRGQGLGGYVALAALARGDVFRAACVDGAISDPAALPDDTDRSAAQALQNPIGEDHSAIRLGARIQRPVMVLHGTENLQVDHAQLQRLVTDLRSRGVEAGYHAYCGETQERTRSADAYAAELWFYAHVLGIRLPDRYEPVALTDTSPGT